MSEGPPSADPMLNRRLEITSRMIGRMAVIFFWVRMTRPKLIVGWLVILALLVTFSLVERLGPASLLYLLVFPSVALLLNLQTRRTFGKLYPPGSVYESSFGPDAMSISGPMGDSVIKYAAFRRIWQSPNGVVIHRRDVSTFHVLPAGLIPTEAVALIRSRMPAR